MATDSQASIVEATADHARELAPRLRAEDVAEVLAAAGETPLQALLGSLERSSCAWALFLDDQVAALWGLVPIPGVAGVAAVWMLGSDSLTHHALTFWRLCRREVPRLLELVPVIVNLVDARYERALRWARRLGFEVLEARPFGPQGLPFHPIVARRRR